MPDDPKKQNETTHSGEKSGQQPDQQRKNPNDSSEKRPTQGGPDKENQEQGGQRRAS